MHCRLHRATTWYLHRPWPRAWKVRVVGSCRVFVWSEVWEGCVHHAQRPTGRAAKKYGPWSGDVELIMQHSRSSGSVQVGKSSWEGEMNHGLLLGGTGRGFSFYHRWQGACGFDCLSCTLYPHREKKKRNRRKKKRAKSIHVCVTRRTVIL
jgi:hypothetical protein